MCHKVKEEGREGEGNGEGQQTSRVVIQTLWVRKRLRKEWSTPEIQTRTNSTQYKCTGYWDTVFGLISELPRCCTGTYRALRDEEHFFCQVTMSYNERASGEFDRFQVRCQCLEGGFITVLEDANMFKGHCHVAAELIPKMETTNRSPTGKKTTVEDVQNHYSTNGLERVKLSFRQETWPTHSLLVWTLECERL